MSDWKQQMKKDLKDWASSNNFKFSEGENVFRILPNKKGLNFPPVFLYMAHPNVGKDSVFSRCGKNTKGEGHCWLCDEKIPTLLESPKAALRAAAEKMRPLRQVVLLAAPIVEGKWRKPKPLLLTVAKKALGNRLLSFISTGTRAYDDPVKGYNLILERTGSGMGTTYGDLQSEENSTKVPSAVLALIKPLEELIESYSPDKQKQALYGKAESEAPDFADDAEETPSEESFEEEAAEETSDEEVGAEVSTEAEEEVAVEEDVALEEDMAEGDFTAEEEVEAEAPPQVKTKPKAAAPKPASKPAPKPAAKPATKPATKPKAKPPEEEEIVF